MPEGRRSARFSKPDRSKSKNAPKEFSLRAFYLNGISQN
jgi:hypothetical protein